MLVTAWVLVLVGLCIMHSKLNSEAWILHDMYRWVENAKSIPKNLVLVNLRPHGCAYTFSFKEKSNGSGTLELLIVSFDW